MGKVLVSAIVSTYKSEEFIEGCLKDLEEQTIRDALEIIVVDSASPENEGKIVREFQKIYDNIVYIRTEERESMYKAWNRAIKVARGEFITNANTDDRHRKDAFEIMLEAFKLHPEVVLVYGDCLVTDVPNETFENNSARWIFKWWDWDRCWLLAYACFMGPQPMWRKWVHRVFGYFDENLKQSGDYEFWLRISQIYDFYRIPFPLGLYYYNPKGVEHSNHESRDKENAAILSLYRKAANEGRIVRCPLLENLASATDEDLSLLPIEVECRDPELVQRELLRRSSWWRRWKESSYEPPSRSTLFPL